MIYSKDGLLDNKLNLLSPEKVQQLKQTLDNQKINQTADGFTKPKGNFIYVIIPDTAYMQLRKMNNSNLRIKKWSTSLLQAMLIGAVASFIIGMLFNKLLYAGILVIPGMLYWQKMQSVKIMYNQWQFERRIQFSKFSRLLIPYLKQATTGVSLYSIFGKIIPRLDSQHDKDLLDILRKDSLDKPNDINPFMEYAEKASGTDEATLFMSTLFDISQGAVDMTVIDELGKQATKSLMEGIDTIIAFKSKKFTMFPTKITLLNLIIIFSYVIAITWYMLQTTGILKLFGGGLGL